MQMMKHNSFNPHDHFSFDLLSIFLKKARVFIFKFPLKNNTALHYLLSHRLLLQIVNSQEFFSMTMDWKEFLVNNSNEPFDHPWLERSPDGSKYIHPLEKFSAEDLVDQDVKSNLEMPPPLRRTPYKFVEDKDGLKLLADELKRVDEFAVDLEHHDYRSFQGITCLMQISTRKEDYIVDTLKLHTLVGPYLREVFKDPSKKKVMHGADKDILWLQRDFGIYIYATCLTLIRPRSY